MEPWGTPTKTDLHDEVQFTADLVTFTEEILNGKLHFLCSKVCPFKATL